MIFNLTKTVCFCVKSNRLKNINIPDIFFKVVNRLLWISSHKYLGVFIDVDFTDDSDLKRQMKSIYCKGNVMLRQKFKKKIVF